MSPRDPFLAALRDDDTNSSLEDTDDDEEGNSSGGSGGGGPPSSPPPGVGGGGVLGNGAAAADDAGPICIEVETLTGGRLELLVPPRETVANLKARIQRVEGIPITQQHLVFRLRELPDSSRLVDEGVQTGAVLRLVLSMRGGPILTRRVPLGGDHGLGWRELRDFIEYARDDMLEKLPPGSKGTVLLFKEGDTINLFRVLENDDGTYSLFSDYWANRFNNGNNNSTTTTTRPRHHNNHRNNSNNHNGAAGDSRLVGEASASARPSAGSSQGHGGDRLVENDAMLAKVTELRRKMEKLNVGRRSSNTTEGKNSSAKKTAAPSEPKVTSGGAGGGGGSGRRQRRSMPNLAGSDGLEPDFAADLRKVMREDAAELAAEGWLPSSQSSSCDHLDRGAGRRSCPAIPSSPHRHRKASAAATAAAAADLLPPVVVGGKRRMRCAHCNRRLSIATVHSCRCGGTYCPQHRYSEAHDCRHDYKAEGRRLIEQANPLVAAQKLPKI